MPRPFASPLPRRVRVSSKFVCAVFAPLGFALSGANGAETWHTPEGKEVRGRLSQVIGPLAIVADGDRSHVIPVNAFTDEELEHVAEFLISPSSHAKTWLDSEAKVTRSLRAHLSVLHAGQLTPFAPAIGQPEPEIYLIYFSAGWCPPCHAFTPELVKAYRELQAAAPGRFEVIFVSDDRSPGEQLGYIREMEMPWPVLDYSFRNQVKVIERWAGPGIPCLVALTRNGDLLYHTYRGSEYAGPDQVVAACSNLVPLFDGHSPAARRALHRLAMLRRLKTSASDQPPQPYLVQIDSARFGDIRSAPVTLTLKLDATGHVIECRPDPAAPAILADLLREQAMDWLFLPAIKQGKTVGAVVKLPVKIGAGDPGS